jgi:UDP-N-acetyl-alpha-D-muramoyl-L-alanyl-L-glutamate epimerase
VGECRAAAILAAQRPDRADTPLLHLLTAQLPASPPLPDVAGLLRPVGEHWIPDVYAADDLLV